MKQLAFFSVFLISFVATAQILNGQMGEGTYSISDQAQKDANEMAKETAKMAKDAAKMAKEMGDGTPGSNNPWIGMGWPAPSKAEVAKEKKLSEKYETEQKLMYEEFKKNHPKEYEDMMKYKKSLMLGGFGMGAALMSADVMKKMGKGSAFGSGIGMSDIGPCDPNEGKTNVDVPLSTHRKKAQSDESDSWSGSSHKTNSVGGAGADLARAVNKLPDGDLKRGMQQYLKVVNPFGYGNDRELGGSNKGIAEFGSKQFASHSCFAELATKFYDDARKTAPTIIKGDSGGSAGCPMCTGNPLQAPSAAPGAIMVSGRHVQAVSLAEKSGTAPFDKIKPGWLWDMAMKYSKGDGNLAMSLIGMCGHDNVSQGEFTNYDKTDVGRQEHDQELKTIEDNLAAKNKQLLDLAAKKKPTKKTSVEKKAPDDPWWPSETPDEETKLRNEIATLQETEKHLQRCNDGSLRSTYCPGTGSGFFAPESLGPGVDIPDDLKKEVSKLQAPKDGAISLPSKHYHVYGGAFMACQLIQQGVSSTLAKEVENQAAGLYRSLRLCSETKGELTARQKAEDLYDDAKDENKALGPNFTADFIQRAIRRPGKDFSTITGAPLDDKDLTPQMISEKAHKAAARMNAAYLYRQWYFGGSKLFGKDIPCTDIKLTNRTLEPTEESSLTKFVYGRNPCGGQFDEMTCDEARHVLATWDVDMQWTKAQHVAGAEFAAKHCKKLSPGEDPYANACSAVGNKENKPVPGDGKQVK